MRTLAKYLGSSSDPPPVVEGPTDVQIRGAKKRGCIIDLGRVKDVGHFDDCYDKACEHLDTTQVAWEQVGGELYIFAKDT